MKTLLRNVTALAVALTLVATSATAGWLTISAHAQNGSSDYDSLGISVPAGAYCSYYVMVIDGGMAQVQVSGPGVNIDDTIYDSGTSSGGGAFSSAGGVSGSVYASSGGQAAASLTVGW